MEAFELLLHQDALEALRNIRGENRKQIRQFLSILPSNPYIQAEASYEDRKGRMVHKIR